MNRLHLLERWTCPVLERWLSPVWTCLVLTSLTIALEELTPFFRTADSLMLRLLPPVEEPRPTPTHEAIVMTVEPSLFNADFGGTTPIDRRTFAKYVDEIAASFPEQAAVVFDFDFGPAGSRAGSYAMPSCGGDAAASVPDELDRALVCLARTVPEGRLDCGGRSKIAGGAGPRRPARSVVLGLPDADGDPQAQALRDAWRDAMRRCGIEFASGSLLVDPLFGSVTRYDPEMDTLSRAALCKLEPRRCATHGAADEPRRHAKASGGEELFINVPAAEAGIGLCPLTRNAGIDTCAADKRGRATPATALFVGGNYLRSDRYPTGFGRLESGVALHAQVFVSRLHELRKSARAGAAFDFFVGLAFFGLLRPFAELRRTALDSGNAGVAAAATICQFAVLACFLWLALLVVFPVALSIHLWLNPIIVLVGLHVHGVVERTEPAAGGQVESESDEPRVAEAVAASLALLGAGIVYFAWKASSELRDDILWAALPIEICAVLLVAAYAWLRRRLPRRVGTKHGDVSDPRDERSPPSCVERLRGRLGFRWGMILGLPTVLLGLGILWAHG